MKTGNILLLVVAGVSAVALYKMLKKPKTATLKTEGSNAEIKTSDFNVQVLFPSEPFLKPYTGTTLSQWPDAVSKPI